MARTAASMRKYKRRRSYAGPRKRFRSSYRRPSRRIRGVTRITRRYPRVNNSVFNFKRRSVPKALWMTNGATDDVAGIMLGFRFAQSLNTDNNRYVILNSTLTGSVMPISVQGCVTSTEYNSFNNLFKYFRICKIKVVYSPAITGGNTALSSSAQGAINNSSAVAGDLIYDMVRDVDQYNIMYPFNEAGQDICMESISSRSKSIYKPHKMYFTPSVLTSVPVTGSSYPLTTPSFKKWLPLLPNTDNENVYHGGMCIRCRVPKQVISQANLSVFDGTDFPVEGQTVPIGMLRFTYYFQMKYQG